MSKPLSMINLETAENGVQYVPTKDCQRLLYELCAKYGNWDNLAVAWAAKNDGSPFAAHRSVWNWRTGKHRCMPDTYDRLWCML